MLWQVQFLLVFMLRGTFGVERQCKVETSCKDLQEEWTDNGISVPYLAQSLDMKLLWSDDLSQAAAALLRATLVAAGYEADRIKLNNRDSVDLAAEDSGVLVVDVVLAAQAQLQVRLTPHAERSLACENASSWSFFQDTNALHKCAFMVPEKKKLAHINIYIVNEWNNTCAAEFLRNFTTTAPSARLIYLDRANLTDLIRDANNSFLFLDKYQQGHKGDVRLVQLPPTSNDTQCDSTPHNTVMLKHGDGLLSETFVVFSPSLSDIYGVIDEYNAKNQCNIEEAACKWAMPSVELQREQFVEWRLSALMTPRRGSALAVVCQAETKDTFNNLVEMTHMIKGYTNDTLSAFVDGESMLLLVAYYDCPNIDMMLKTSIVMFRENRISKLEGVILPENMAVALAPYAAKLDIPLLTYDVNSKPMGEPAVRSATGTMKHFELALRRLLADCGWKRIAVISEPTPFAKALSAALRAPSTQLTIREMNVTSPSDISCALQELLDADARVFLVNTGAAMAAAVLSEGQKLNITRNNGFGWIVRDYETADNATSVTRPYSVSFSWRGEKENITNNKREKIDMLGDDGDISEKTMGDEAALRVKLEEKWRGRAWPLHAAQLLNALLTLREGSRRYHHSTTWVWPRAKNVTSFWNYVQREPIPSINQNLMYDETTVTAPLVFVEQWGTDSRPSLLATWRGGEWRDPAEVCPAVQPPLDGSISCFIPSGDPFQPKCWDITAIVSVVLTTAIGTTVVVTAIHYLRKVLTARDLRIKTEFAKRLLARRERVFEALADHLVDRSALELLQELGTGRFGRVHQGLLRQSGSKNHNIVVAAKALKEEASSAEESEFLREACTLKMLHHDHIIRFLGVCVVDGPPLLLMEHAFFGDLLHYLQARRCLAEGSTNIDTGPNWFHMDEKANVSAKSLTKLAQEAAAALAYLAQRGIVHRDLRASNCLVDERRCLKLADFGLARATGTIDGEYACRRGLFPVLWMAPESLGKGVSSAASDVWSFGVLVFELVTLGRRPYGVQPPPTVLRHVLAGGRPQLPWDASAETRALTRACWRREPEARPTAAQLADWLSVRRQVLRPALVTELVDIDSHVYGNNDSSELDLIVSENSLSQVQTSQQSIAMIPIKTPKNIIDK